MTPDRSAQLAYTELQPLMSDEDHRRRKAAKILAVLRQHLGAERLDGLVVVDLGSSAGFIADELHRAGGRVVGVDIDVPGTVAARRRFPDVVFLCADGTRLPLADGSVDVVVFNHIYEHVLDPDGVVAEIRRVLRDGGVAYFGFGNRLGVMEPHYRLPFLSWLPARAADRYMRLAGRGDRYHERYRTRAGLRRLTRGLGVWDYTLTVIAEPARFAADDLVPRRLAGLPAAAWRLGLPVLPTYLWVGTKGGRPPGGPPPAVPPERLH